MYFKIIKSVWEIIKFNLKKYVWCVMENFKWLVIFKRKFECIVGYFWIRMIKKCIIIINIVN